MQNGKFEDKQCEDLDEIYERLFREKALQHMLEWITSSKYSLPPTLNLEIIGARIRELRKNKKTADGRKLSQEQMAEEMYCHRTTIQRIEKGEKTLSKEELFGFAKYFGTTIPYIIGETDIKDPLQYSSVLLKMGEYTREYKSRMEDSWLEYTNKFFMRCGYFYDYDPFDKNDDISPQILALEADQLKSADSVWLENENDMISGLTELGEEDADQAHRLIDPEGSHEPIYLSYKDLQRIWKKVHAFLAAEFRGMLDERAQANGDS